jgi:hypothetical protein
MKRLIVAFVAMIVMTLTAWGQNPSSEPRPHSTFKAHRNDVPNGTERRHHRHHRHHGKRHHHHHTGA